MFSREMTSKERTQKFHTNDVHYPDLDSASDSSSLEGDLSGVGSDRSSVWNFCACSLKGNQRWCREMWTVSTGYSSLAGLHFQKRSFNELFCYSLTYK